MIHVLIRARNAERYIANCLKSLFNQTNKEWAAWLFLDNPTDKTKKIAEEYIGYGRDVLIIENETRYGLGKNMYEGIQAICRVADDEDIIAVVDGDDKLKKRAFKNKK